MSANFNFKSETRNIVSLKSQDNFKIWKNKVESPKFIGLLSPFYEQYNVFRDIFPESKILVFDVKSWDLNDKKAFQFDIISASSVFMYSNDPKKWFNNVFSSCKYFWIQDLINRNRSDSGILGADGDKMRYSFSPDFISDFSESYDLSEYQERIIDYVQFNVNESSHFLANIRGDLDDAKNPNLDIFSKYRNLWFKSKSFFRK